MHFLEHYAIGYFHNNNKKQTVLQATTTLPVGKFSMQAPLDWRRKDKTQKQNRTERNETRRMKRKKEKE